MTDNVTDIADRAARETNNGANATELKRIVAEADSELSSVEAQIEELKTQRKEIRARVKGAGMNLKEFDFSRKMRDLDAEDRTEKLDAIRLCFEALGVGEQGQLFPDQAA